MAEFLSQEVVLRPEYAKRIGSVKAALQLFGERSQRGEDYSDKDNKDLNSRERELHFARRDIGMLSESRSSAENEMARLKLELSEKRKIAESLALRIEESKARARARKQELEALKMQKRGKEEIALTNGEVGNLQYMELVRELEAKKRELSNLRLNMVSVLGSKVKAEEETKAAHFRLRSSLKTIEKLGKEIDEADEEHVLVELARIEAIKESKEIETKRDVEAARYSQKLQESKARIVGLKKEVNRAKKLEQKLTVTTSDLDVLQSEMMFVRAMEKKSTYKSSVEQIEKNNELESERVQLLQSAQAELQMAKDELTSIKEGGFKYMASMDAVREKMKRVSSEASRLRKMHEETDMKVQDLNAKLLRANYELEAASTAEKRRQAVVSNLSTALSNSQSERDKERKEKEQAVTKTEQLKTEIWMHNSNIDSMKETLLTAMQELELIKYSETAVLDKLRTLCEKTMRSRALSSRHRSTITIPNFEYEYLRKCAAGANEIANKKVEAALAWVEAFNASEKEVLLQTERVERKIEEIGELGEELQPYGVEEESIAETKEKRRRSLVERETQTAKTEIAFIPPRKSLKENGMISTSRRSSMQRKSLASNSQIPSRAPSINLRRRRKVMQNLAKFIGRGRVGAHNSGV